MNAIFISCPRGCRRAVIAMTLLALGALAVGCSRGGSHSAATSRNESVADTSHTVAASSAAQQAEPQQAAPQQTTPEATTMEKTSPEPKTPAKAAPAPRQTAHHQTAPQKPAQPQNLVLPAGSHIVAALQSGISTADAKVGDKVTVQTAEPVAVEGRTVIPTGSTINGEVTFVKGAGRIKGAPELTLQFNEIVLPDGHAYAIACEPFHVIGKSAGGESLKEIGGGAAAGAVVGALLGKGKGALKGAAVGTAAGAGVALATKGQQIELPAGQQISLDLTTPLTLPAGE
jgi:hypothetical protein